LGNEEKQMRIILAQAAQICAGGKEVLQNLKRSKTLMTTDYNLP